MAKKNSGVSLKPISTEIGRAVRKLKGARLKASSADKKILSLKMRKLKKLNESLYFLCRRGRNVMDAIPVARRLARPPLRSKR